MIGLSMQNAWTYFVGSFLLQCLTGDEGNNRTLE